jgi:hypothetical protein
MIPFYLWNNRIKNTVINAPNYLKWRRRLMVEWAVGWGIAEMRDMEWIII